MLLQDDALESLGHKPNKNYAIEKVSKNLQIGHNYFVAISQENQPIGFIAGHTQTENKYVSNGIYVAPEHRKQGIGTRLKELQLALAKEMHCILLTTTVETDNAASIALQKKFKATFKEHSPNVEVEILL